MKKEKIVKIFFGFTSGTLLIALIIRVKYLPGGIILPGYFLGGLSVVSILLGCLLLTPILRIVFKRIAFETIFFVILSISFLGFHYVVYSPILEIKVPNGYIGPVNLMLSTSDTNILIVDNNGIGYLNEWTFHKTFARPIVEQLDGTNIQKQLVGFNQSTFFGKSKWCCLAGQEIESLSFEIVPTDKIGQKQYYSSNLTDLVNEKLVKR